jgi:hypothetical protein
MKNYAYMWDNLTPEERLSLLRVTECPSSALIAYSVRCWTSLTRDERVKVAVAIDRVSDT